MTTITTAEWMKALEDAQASRKSEDGMTRDEIADALGISVNRVGKMLKELHKGNRLWSGYAMRQTIVAGRMASVPVYRITP